MSRFFPKNQIWAAGVMHPTKLSSAGFILSICCETFNVPPSFAVVKTSIASDAKICMRIDKTNSIHWKTSCFMLWLKPWTCWARKHVRLFGKERTFALLCIPLASLDRPSLAETFIGKKSKENSHYHHLYVIHLVPMLLQPCRLLLFWPKPARLNLCRSQLQTALKKSWFSWAAFGSNHSSHPHKPSFS